MSGLKLTIDICHIYYMDMDMDRWHDEGAQRTGRCRFGRRFLWLTIELSEVRSLSQLSEPPD